MEAIKVVDNKIKAVRVEWSLTCIRSTGIQ